MVPFVGLAFSPLGWLAGLVTRLNRHGYFISRPPKRADPTHDPRKLRNGGPRVGSDESRKALSLLPFRCSKSPH